MGRRARVSAALLLAAVLLAPSSSPAEEVEVLHWEGLTHGFVALRSLDGKLLADGDLVQTTAPTPGGNRVTTQLVLRFKDGSLHDETTVYVQHGTFRLVGDHVVQRGPAFEMPLESTIAENGQVSVRYTDKDGKEKRIEEHLDLPPDVANGMILSLLKNISPRKPKTTVSMVAFTPKPRLVKLDIVPAGEDSFSTATSTREATHFRLKVVIPGLAGAFASLFGKVPPDSHVWILGGEAPAFVKAELALYPGGPIWRLELLSPVWPHPSFQAAPKEPGEAAASKDGKR